MSEVLDAVEKVSIAGESGESETQSEVDEPEEMGTSLGEAFEALIKKQETEDAPDENIVTLLDQIRSLTSKINSLERSEGNKEKLLRKFALLALDDQNGINYDSYRILVDLLMKNHSDIMGATEVMEDRVFINEDFAEEELGKLS